MQPRPAPGPETSTDPGAFGADELDALGAYFDSHGYATLRGAVDEDDLAATESELVRAQDDLVGGGLDTRHATAILDDPDATVDGRRCLLYTSPSPRD